MGGGCVLVGGVAVLVGWGVCFWGGLAVLVAPGAEGKGPVCVDRLSSASL